MKYVKGFVALAIAIATGFCLGACATSEKTLVEKTIEAVSNADIDGLSGLVATGSEDNVNIMRGYFSAFDDEKLAAYKLLMKNVGVVSYSDENKSASGSTDTTVTFRLKHIDFDELMCDVETEISVDGTPSAEVISKICSSEKINGYIIYDDVTASVVRMGRRSFVEFGQKSEFFEVMGISAFLRWFSSH